MIAKRKKGKRQASEEFSWTDTVVFVSSQLFRFLNRLIWPGTILASLWIMYLMVDALAGKVTHANILADVALNWGLDRLLAYAVGVGGASYGLYERRTRLSSLREERERNRRYEELADPTRTGSGLVNGGLPPSEPE